MTRFCLLLATILIAMTNSAQVRKALVVGNANYEGGNTLNNATNDARKIRDALVQCQFSTAFKTDLGKTQFVKFIDSMFRPAPSNESVALFYYAGHSLQVDGRHYLLPAGEQVVNKTNVKQKAIPLDDIFYTMKRSGSKINIVLLDACRNNPFEINSEQKELAALTFTDNPGNFFIGFSTSPGLVARDGTKENSFFSNALAKHMIEPGLELAEIFRNIINDVTTQEPGQIPYFISTLAHKFNFTVNDPVKNSSTNVSGKIAVRINSTLVCDLFLDGMNIGRGMSFLQWLSYGKHTIRAISNEFRNIIYSDSIVLDKNDEGFEQVRVLPLADMIIDQYKLRLDSATGKNRAIYGNNDVQNKLAELSCTMVYFKAGEFKMGSNNGNLDEQPVHQVKLKNFHISKVEVTQVLWSTIMGSLPPLQEKECPNCPVVNVSWDDANEFITRLNEISGEQYRLPTEAEWEYAARAGVFSEKNTSAEESDINQYAWYMGNTQGIRAVGGLAANKKGLFDMCGNVAEWCSDWYETFYYKNSKVDNPRGPDTGNEKVVRGGSWDDDARFCRIFNRKKFPVKTKKRQIGFRLAKTA